MRKPNLYRFAVFIQFFLVIAGCSERKQMHAPLSQKGSQCRELLCLADSLLGSNFNLSEKNAKTVLSIARASKDTVNEMSALLIMGKALTLAGENDSAYTLFNSSLILAKQLGNDLGICNAILEIGDVHYTWGEYDTAMLYFLHAKQIADTKNLEECKARALNYMGKFYHTRREFEKTYDCYSRALDISRTMGNRKLTAWVLVNLGKYYISLGKLNLAMSSYQEAYRISDKLNDRISFAEVCNHLGGLYMLINQPEQALFYHKKALSCRNKVNNPEGIAKSYNNIGKIFMEEKLPDSALLYFRESLSLCKKTGYGKGKVKALTNLGNTYAFLNNQDREKEVLDQAFTLASSMHYSIGVAEASMALGNYYYNKKSYDEAVEHYLLSLSNLKQSNLYEILHDDYRGLFQSYQHMKQTGLALAFHIKLAGVEKTMMSEENNRQMAMLRISFDSERKEKDNQVLRKDNELKEMTIKRKSAFIWLFVLAFGFSILISMLIYSRFRIKKKDNQRLRVLNAKILLQNKELAKLNSELEKLNRENDKVFSIITHELRNPLYWFQNLAEVLAVKYQSMSPEKIQRSLGALNESAKNFFQLMDNLLNWSRSKLKRIRVKRGNHKLLPQVQECVKMFTTILDQKEIDILIEVTKDAEAYMDIDLMNVVLRNLLSNAIKFTPSKGSIRISCVRDSSWVTIMVSDSGMGISQTNIKFLFDNSEFYSTPGLMQEKGSGLGLKICQEFVELLGGKIWVESIPGEGSSFYFTLPGASVAEPAFITEYSNL